MKAVQNKNWVIKSLNDLPRKDEERNEIIRFWDEFYNYLLQNTNMSGQSGQTRLVQYKEEVFNILHDAKASLPLSEEKLRKIQMEIEDLTIFFDEKSLFKTAPNIIRLLRGRVHEKDNMELLSEFGQYRIEALIVHVLGMVFNILEFNSIIHVASLVERLESSVRIQASLLKSRRCKKSFSMATDDFFQVKMSGMDRKRSKLELMYPFGSGLVQFMEERGLITLMSDLSGTVRVMKKKGSYFLPSHLYVVCNFDISLLPIKLNLPMVCQPLDSTSVCPSGQKPRNLFDLSGGYLSGPTGEIYDRCCLLSTGDINPFNIDIGRGDGYENLCRVMNKLQRQAFQINSDWLNFIQNYDALLWLSHAKISCLYEYKRCIHLT